MWAYRIRDATARVVARCEQAMLQVSETESVGLSENEIAGNSILIEAAPNMLQALREMVDASRLGCHDVVRRVGLAAIAKATTATP